ncbi:MAG: orotidine-5'-phosphate decarboxylase [Chitinophagales bacterium]
MITKTMTKKQAILTELFDIDAIQFGKFELRSGIMSPFYLDFRKIISYPQLLKDVCAELANLVEPLPFDYLCGVPYAALSIATGVAMTHNTPLVVKRKQRKAYGTKKLIEGDFEVGQSCIVVEDIVTSGVSIVSTIKDLEEVGLKVKHAIALVDREQGGTTILAKMGYQVHFLFTMTEVLDFLLAEGKIDEKTHQDTLTFISKNVTKELNVTTLPTKPLPVPSYEERQEKCLHPTAKRLLDIMQRKQTNLTLSADVDTSQELLDLADKVGEHICMLKLHADIYGDFNAETVAKLQTLAQKHDFLLFEDSKFADIGNTVKKQFTSKLMNIAAWADVVTVHVVAGEASVTSLKDTGYLDKTALILIAQMSTKDTLTDSRYMMKAVQIAEKNADCVMGMVAQKRLSKNMGLLQFTPGVHLHAKGDNSGQTYNTPQIAFSERGADVIIVGRGIYKAENPVEATIAYKNAAWKAYLDRNA